MKNKNKIGIFIVIACGILWGLSGVMNQLIFINSNLTSGSLCGIRSTLSGFIIITCVFIKNKTKVFDVFRTKKSFISILIFTVVGVMGMQFSYAEAIRQSNAATATVLQYIYPSIILIWHSIKTRKLPKVYETVAIVISFIGVVLIATHGDFGNLYITPLALTYGLIAAVTYMIYTVYPMNLYDKYGVATVAGFAQLIGGITFFALNVNDIIDTNINGKTAFFIAASMVSGTIIPFVCYGIGVRIIGSVKASLFVTIEPVASAVMAFLILGVKFYLIDIAGFACIIGAIELVAYISSKNSVKDNKKVYI